MVQVRRGPSWLITEKPVLSEEEQEDVGVHTRSWKSTFVFRDDVMIHTMAVEADSQRFVCKVHYRKSDS